MSVGDPEVAVPTETPLFSTEQEAFIERLISRVVASSSGLPVSNGPESSSVITTAATPTVSSAGGVGESMVSCSVRT